MQAVEAMDQERRNSQKLYWKSRVPKITIGSLVCLFIGLLLSTVSNTCNIWMLVTLYCKPIWKDRLLQCHICGVMNRFLFFRQAGQLLSHLIRGWDVCV